jgi:acetyl-CoA/propionyl-CoA carboxylase biotin carboxyl carrier protein
VLEETPSPAVDSGRRNGLTESAVRLASAVDYASAGTVEFLVTADGFWFLEMNTRLQVEHPVTEMATGRDLVADQLRIAAGEPLGFGQVDVRPSGHAIEVRLYAEDADAGFLPAPGRVVALAWPEGEGIRVDAGVDVGDEVSARFDPLLAKVVAWGPDRSRALARLRGALDATLVLGVTTNLGFLRWLVRQAWLLQGDARVDTLEPAWAAARAAARMGGDVRTAGDDLPDDAWDAAARALTAGSTDIWGGGWRLGGRAVVRLTADGVGRRVEIEPQHGAGAAERMGSGNVHGRGPTVDPRPRAVAVDRGVANVDVEGRSVAISLELPPDVDAAARTPRARAGRTGRAAAGGPSQVIAPMPGSVVAVRVSVGSDVESGDPIVTLEAMKMEHAVTAPVAGRVTDVAVAAGSQVVRGQLLAIVEPGPGPGADLGPVPDLDEP